MKSFKTQAEVEVGKSIEHLFVNCSDSIETKLEPEVRTSPTFEALSCDVRDFQIDPTSERVDCGMRCFPGLQRNGLG